MIPTSVHTLIIGAGSAGCVLANRLSANPRTAYCCGGKRMPPGSPHDFSVVDPQLRVRGVKNPYIADTSIMPDMVSGNRNGPATALAWRAAESISNVQGDS